MSAYTSFECKCPKCGAINEVQSKSGPQNNYLHYSLHDHPDLDNVNDSGSEFPEEILNINRHAPYDCRTCDCKFKVVLSTVEIT